MASDPYAQQIAGRVPPHDLDAEAAVLSAILLSREALGRVLEILKPEHFYSDANGRIYDAARELAAVGSPVDTVTVATWLRTQGRLAQVGGAAYLAQISDATPAVANVDHHATIVREKHRVRAVVATAQRIAALGYGPITDVELYAEEAARDLARIRDAVPASKAPSWGERVNAALSTMMRRSEKKETAIPTPWSGFNDKIQGGFWPGLYLLSSGTGMGKTQWALQVALHAAQTFAESHKRHGIERTRQGLPPAEGGPDRVVYVALELGDVDLTARILGLLAADLPPGDATALELARLMAPAGLRAPLMWSDFFFGKAPPEVIALLAARFGQELAELPIDVETADAIGWSYQNLRKVAEKYNPRLLVLDYAQLVSADLDAKKREELRETIGNVAKVARDLARRRDLTVLALSSTARSNYSKVRGRDGEAVWREHPDDLVDAGKESGELEFTADVVLALVVEPKPAEGKNGPTEGDQRSAAIWEAVSNLEGKRRYGAYAKPMHLVVAKGRGFHSSLSPLVFNGSRFVEADDDGEAPRRDPALYRPDPRTGEKPDDDDGGAWSAV